jgi:hypothetical protein
MPHIGNESGGGASPPIGKRIEMSINFQQAQDVTVRKIEARILRWPMSVWREQETHHIP